MRDPNRIHHMLQLLRNVWTLNPDLRLGQLIDNARFYHSDKSRALPILFNIEDEDMEECLTRMLNASVQKYDDN